MDDCVTVMRGSRAAQRQGGVEGFGGESGLQIRAIRNMGCSGRDPFCYLTLNPRERGC